MSRNMGGAVRNLFENISVKIASTTSRKTDEASKYVAPSGLELPRPSQLRRRLKFAWPVLLLGNLSLGGYFYAKKRESNLEQRSSAVEETLTIPAEVTAKFSEGLVLTPEFQAVIMKQLLSPKVQEHDRK